jgi:hypothetical protein
MPTYQIKFTDKKGYLVGEDEFVAEHHDAAGLVGQWLFEASSDVYVDYLLIWHCRRNGFKSVPKLSLESFLRAGSRHHDRHQVILRAQEVALARQRALADAYPSLVGSRRFLDALAILAVRVERNEQPPPPRTGAERPMLPRIPAKPSAPGAHDPARSAGPLIGTVVPAI